VACVGSLLVGGAGKTPAAAWLAAALARRGHRVALASRGHGGRRRERVLVVSDGRRLHAHGEEAGDEALVLAARAPGVPVLVARDRALAGLRAHALFGAEILVSTTFQHRSCLQTRRRDARHRHPLQQLVIRAARAQAGIGALRARWVCRRRARRTRRRCSRAGAGRAALPCRRRPRCASRRRRRAASLELRGAGRPAHDLRAPASLRRTLKLGARRR
jgi:tetraacyldisaccharide 4'-kinase